MKEKILASANSPRELESLYRASPEDFVQGMKGALAEDPESAILQVWRERLFFEELPGIQSAAQRVRRSDILLAIALSLIAGTLAKLPVFFPQIDAEKFCARNIPGIVFGALIAFFCVQRPADVRKALFVVAVFAGTILFLNSLPGNKNSSTTVLACLHAPFIFWSLLGFSFLGGAWKNLAGRMEFLRFNGELLIHSTIILIGGMVLTGLTFALFGLIHLDITDWYMKNIVITGAVASPVVGTLLVDRVVGDRFKIAPLLARIFTPLFLLTVTAYLIAMAMNHRSPFTDRDFLVAFNGLLLIVLGLCVFSVSGRAAKSLPGAGDLMNTGLVSITLAIDLVALSAILFRLRSEGITPNRMAVLGANMLVFCHLAGILWCYIRFLRKKAFGLEHLENWIAAYLPIYTAWCVVVAFGFPLAFGFR